MTDETAGPRPAGLQAVFLDMRPMLTRLLTARLGGREEAEDALQDMWLKLDQPLKGPVAQPQAYLYRMAANLATDRRVASRRGQARDAAWLDVQPGAHELPSAERELIDRDRLRRVQTIMDEMPPRMSEALRMFRLDERPQKEIAARLGISVSGVEKLLQRAYRALHDAENNLGEDLAGPRRLIGEGDLG